MRGNGGTTAGSLRHMPTRGQEILIINAVQKLIDQAIGDDSDVAALSPKAKREMVAVFKRAIAKLEAKPNP